MGRPAKATVRQHDSWGGGPGSGCRRSPRTSTAPEWGVPLCTHAADPPGRGLEIDPLDLAQ